ncbi:hypothetical protein PGT21_006327 [Puccinia graminis f. sp. tritici]|uniref:Uncharacterized protein n=1 Tax=Puccinia graminis f. sp. tritici TaxID=56615 RepID=A0A5B0P6A3_PUCGR|nr:hypothetical protein PGT21_006327 [Puccinia graminis f. sp. tritici]KAA1104906.1 hypothetical protein PGTUg99_009516 [Puccinia graminis f. sp. tritici]
MLKQGEMTISATEQSLDTHPSQGIIRILCPTYLPWFRGASHATAPPLAQHSPVWSSIQKATNSPSNGGPVELPSLRRRNARPHLHQ